MFNVELDDLTEEEDYHDQRIVENIHRHQIVAIFLADGYLRTFLLPL